VPAADAVAVRLGAMIETPAAAGASGALAAVCDFLSFGTNDLTQLLLGLSREDYPALLPAYHQFGLLGDDPFQRLHPAVLDCLRAAAGAARRARPSIGLGLCGLHAADPAALGLWREGCLDYLSVSQRQFQSVKLAALQQATARPA
jgi:pyruvate,orthophosphate dikinase